MKLKSLFSLLLVVLVQTGCTSSTTCSDDTCGEGTVCNASTGLCELADDTGETTESETTSCVTDADCDDATQRCDNGTCVSKCDGVTCNEAAGEICDPTTGLCVGGSGGCNLDEDCGDGQVCEEGLCVGGRYAGCDGQNPCSSKLSCRYGIGFSFCVEACESHDSCFPNEACTPPDLPGFQDFAGHCFWNACAPGGGMNNNMQDREWLERCDVAEPGDNAGIFYGPIFNGTENFAWCLAQRGGAALGEPCSQQARQGDDDACSEGICAYGTNICSPVCGIDDGIACSESGDSACYPQVSPNGVCYPTVANPPGLGEPCTIDSPSGMPCKDDLLCGYPTGDTTEPTVCVEICDSQAAVGGPASCQEGQTCVVFDPNTNPRAGVCLNL